MKKVLYIMSILALTPMVCAMEIAVESDANKLLLECREYMEKATQAKQALQGAFSKFNRTVGKQDQRIVFDVDLQSAIMMVQEAFDLARKLNFNKHKDVIKDADKRSAIKEALEECWKQLNNLYDSYGILNWNLSVEGFFDQTESAVGNSTEKKLLAQYEKIEKDALEALEFAKKAMSDYDKAKKSAEDVTQGQKKVIGIGNGLAISWVNEVDEQVYKFKQQFDKDKDSIKDADKRDEIEKNIDLYSKQLETIISTYDILLFNISIGR